MTNSQGRKYDLEERTSKFGENIIKFCRELPKNDITKPIINQLIRCGTSVGANYCEADDAECKADFRHKIGICKKQSRETKYFLRMIVTAETSITDSARILWTEAK